MLVGFWRGGYCNIGFVFGLGEVGCGLGMGWGNWVVCWIWGGFCWWVLCWWVVGWVWGWVACCVLGELRVLGGLSGVGVVSVCGWGLSCGFLR